PHSSPTFPYTTLFRSNIHQTNYYIIRQTISPRSFPQTNIVNNNACSVIAFRTQISQQFSLKQYKGLIYHADWLLMEARVLFLRNNYQINFCIKPFYNNS